MKKAFKIELILLVMALLVLHFTADAQTGGMQSGAIAKGIDKAATELNGVGKSVANLMLPVCLIMGFIGGMQCVLKFFNNDPKLREAIINWGAAIIVAGVITLVLNLTFGS